MRQLRVAAECAATHELLQMIKAFRPQVVVLEIDDANLDPLAVTKNIRSSHPDLPIMISSGKRDAMLASRLMRSGAQGYILHGDWPVQGARALSLMVGGSRYVTECVMQEILQHLGELEPPAGDARLQALTDRELIVYQFIGQGHPCSRIAREMHVASRTVATYRSSIKRKMNLNTDGELLASAQQWVKQRNG